jgi:hypothetical protein
METAMGAFGWVRASAAIGTALFAIGSPASGQCMHWQGMPTVWNGHDLTVYDIGSGPELYAGSDPAVVRWTGTHWVEVGVEFNDDVRTVCGFNDGGGPMVYAAGRFTADLWTGQPIWHIAKVSVGGYSNLGNGLPTPSPFADVYSMLVFDDGSGPQLYVAGSFTTYAGIASDNIVRWNGAWSGVGGGLALSVSALCVFDDGTGPALYASTVIQATGGGLVGALVKWDGAAWTIVASGMTRNGGQPTSAFGLVVYDDGSGPAVFAGGYFDTVNGIPANGLAKWDATGWSAVPGVPLAPVNSVRSLAVHDDGSAPALYVAGLASLQFHGFLARWDGSTWSSLGSGPGTSSPESMLTFDDGQGAGPALCATGQFLTVGGNIPSQGAGRWYGGCTHAIDPLCFGDGTYAVCPCSNWGALGHGCGNSAAGGGLLSSSGTTNPDALVLTSSSEPPTSTSLFLQSDILAPDFSVFGDGLLCLGGQLRRMYVKSASGGTAQAPGVGDPSITQRSAALGDPILPGSVRYYQVWYRDNATYCNAARYNVSNGLRVVW